MAFQGFGAKEERHSLGWRGSWRYSSSCRFYGRRRQLGGIFRLVPEGSIFRFVLSSPESIIRMACRRVLLPVIAVFLLCYTLFRVSLSFVRVTDRSQLSVLTPEEVSNHRNKGISVFLRVSFHALGVLERSLFEWWRLLLRSALSRSSHREAGI